MKVICCIYLLMGCALNGMQADEGQLNEILVAAVRQKCPDTVRYALKHGADVYVTINRVSLPEHVVNNELSEIALILMEYGVDITTIAIQKRKLSFVQKLINYDTVNRVHTV